jgi:hypothetical protein
MFQPTSILRPLTLTTFFKSPVLRTQRSQLMIKDGCFLGAAAKTAFWVFRSRLISTLHSKFRCLVKQYRSQQERVTWVFFYGTFFSTLGVLTSMASWASVLMNRLLSQPSALLREDPLMKAQTHSQSASETSRLSKWLAATHLPL